MAVDLARRWKPLAQIAERSDLGDAAALHRDGGVGEHAGVTELLPATSARRPGTGHNLRRVREDE